MRHATSFPFTFTPQTVYKRERLPDNVQRVFVPVPAIVAGRSRQLAFETGAAERFELGERVRVTAGEHKHFDRSDFTYFDAGPSALEAPALDDAISKISGMSRADSESLRKRFGDDFAQRIASTPELLKETKFSIQKRAIIVEKLRAEVNARLTGEAGRMQVLMKRAGFSTAVAKRALKDHGFADPVFQLVWRAGLPFAKVNRLAQMPELAAFAPHVDCLQAITFDVVRRLSSEGSILHSVDAIADRVWKEFGFERRDVENALAWLAHYERLNFVEYQTAPDPLFGKLFGAPPPSKRYAAPAMLKAEDDIETELKRLAKLGSSRASAADHAFMEDVISEAAGLLQRPGIEIDAEQRAALHAIIDHKVSIVTGPPGAGKTAVMALLSAYALEHKDQTRKPKDRVQGVALSGRAARVLARQSRTDWIKSHFEIDAATIHAAFGIYGEGDDAQLSSSKAPDVWALIVDEASMLSSPLAAMILRQAKVDRFIFVGDENQLPAIGAKPFADIIARVDEFGIPVIRLKNNYRAKSASIRALCNDINVGDVEDDADIYFEGVRFVSTSPADKVAACASLFIEALDDAGDVEDVAIIAPTNVGEHGVEELNRAARDFLNYPPNEFIRGDVLICTKNLYDEPSATTGEKCSVFNGERGTITQVGKDFIEVAFDRARTIAIARPVVVSAKTGRRVNGIGNRVLLPPGFAFGYAMTTHKAQGSGFSRVILPAMKPVRQNPASVNRANLYTAASRAVDELIIVGDWSDFQNAALMEAPRRVTKLQGNNEL